MSPGKYAEFKNATAEDPVMQVWQDIKVEPPADIRLYWIYR